MSNLNKSKGKHLTIEDRILIELGRNSAKYRLYKKKRAALFNL